MAEKPTTTIDVTWEGGFRFESRDAHGHSVTVDAPQKDGDRFEGFMPGELLLTSLSGCSGIDVINILQKQRQDVTGLEIRVKGSQQPDAPWTWDEIELQYTVRGKGLNKSAVERAIQLSETKYCSVGATLSGRTNITSTFEVLEDSDRSE